MALSKIRRGPTGDPILNNDGTPQELLLCTCTAEESESSVCPKNQDKKCKWAEKEIRFNVPFSKMKPSDIREVWMKDQCEVGCGKYKQFPQKDTINCGN